jgi:glycosyltransferase involved in cell wall biosynthesis
MVDVSVVIPCFNARRWIGDALRSVYEQGQTSIEVILVDDGSTDGSAELVERAFPLVRVIRVENGGPSRARNIGTRLAQGRYIQYLDADDLLAAGKFSAQVRALETSGAEIAYGDWREIRSHPYGGDVPGRLVTRVIEGDPTVALITDFWCPPAVYLLRRSVVERITGWDEEQMVIEDVRFMLECALAGAEFVHCPGVVAYYRAHTEGSQSTRDPIAFTRGCMHNAVMLEQRWASVDGWTEPRRAALLKVYGQVARASFARDDETFETVYTALHRLQPRYTPPGPPALTLMSRLVGYRSAEAIAVHYRNARTRLRTRR